MSKKLYLLISFVLVLSLAYTSYGAYDPCTGVVGNWEDVNDGWDIWPASTGFVTTAYSTTGATLDSKSQKLIVTEGGWQAVWRLRFQDDPNLLKAFFDNDEFSIDVTRLAAEWQGPGGICGVHLVVNANSNLGGIIWNDLGGRLWWGPGDGDRTQTAIWDYSYLHDGINDGNDSNNPEIGPNDVNYVELIIVTNFDDTNYPQGIYYLDKAKLSVKPSYGIIGDWENSSDGWMDWDENRKSIDNPDLMPSKYTYSSDWQTLGNKSLKMTDIGFSQNLAISIMGTAHLAEFLASTKIALDIRYPATTKAGWQEINTLLLNSGGGGSTWGWTALRTGPIPESHVDYGPGGGPEVTFTLTFDYSRALPLIGPTPGWVELILSTNSDPNHGVFYFDNVRLLGATLARLPKPANGEEDTKRTLTLSWKPGMYAADVNGHKVYLDADQQKVTNRSGCEVNGVVTDDPCYGPIGPLNVEQTYYWAVDEVNDAYAPYLWSGDIWKFTTSSYYTTVEEFDSYANDDALRVVWKTLLGAVIWIQPGENDANLVRGGNSMLYQYDNYDKLYSEAYARPADLPSGIGSNWTIGGVKALSLYFYGRADNDVSEPMYVKLTDVGNHSKIVYYDGDMNDIKKEEWQEWSIPLAAFTTVSPANVKRITIGLGDGIAQLVEDKGTVYFDEIRLYPPKCILSERDPAFAKADYAPFGYPLFGDCEIDYQELEIMANTWLAEDDVIAPTTDPNIAGGLVAYYPLNEGSGTTTEDVVGDNDGTFTGGVTWITPGLMGNSAVYVNGADGSRIGIGTWNPVDPDTNELTLSIWAKWFGPRSVPELYSHGLIGKRNGWSATELMFMFEITSFGNSMLALRQYGDAQTDVTSGAVTMMDYRGVWTHLAATWDGNDARLYINGREVGSGPFFFGSMTDASMAIGNTNGDNGSWLKESFNGELDEARIYNRALSPAEIAYLADTTPGDGSLYVPAPSPAELYDAEPKGSRIVNFKDFAVLANIWLEKDLFP